MKIQNQHIYGGSQQFADTIINSSKNLSQQDAPLIKFVADNVQGEPERAEFVRALDTLKDEKKTDEEKSEAQKLWKKFLESGVSEMAKESVKSLVSPTFWAILLS